MVLTLRKSFRLISVFVCPRAISLRTSSSTLGEAVGRTCRRRRLRGHPSPEARVEVRVAASRELDRLEELLVRRLLEDEPERPALERLARERRVILHRQDHDGGLRRGLAEPGDRLQTRAARHVEVEHRDGRTMRPDDLHRRRHVAGFGDDVKVILRLEQKSQSTADDRMVVGDHHTDRPVRHRASLTHSRWRRRPRRDAATATSALRVFPDRGSGGFRRGRSGSAGWTRARAKTAWASTSINPQQGGVMSKFFKYGGVVASIVLIAFGIGAVYTGVDGRDRVQSDLAREQIVGTPDSTIPNQLVDTGSEAQAFADGDAQAHARGDRRQDLRADAALPRRVRQGHQRREAAAADPKSGEPVANPARNIWVT